MGVPFIRVLSHAAMTIAWEELSLEDRERILTKAYKSLVKNPVPKNLIKKWAKEMPI
jgi:hypothetical protein